MAVRALCKDVTSRCVEIRTLRLARSISRLYEGALGRVGLTGNQFGLLVAIELIRPDSIAAISAAAAIDPSTISRSLTLLEKAGYVVRGPEGPARKRVIALTAEGVAKIEEAYPLWKGVQTRIEELLGPQDTSKALSRIDQLFAVSQGLMGS